MTPLKPCVFPHQHFSFFTEFFSSEINQVAFIPCLFGLCSSCGNAAIFYYFFFFYQGVPTQPQIASLAFLEYIFNQSVCLFKQKSFRVSVILLNKRTIFKQKSSSHECKAVTNSKEHKYPFRFVQNRRISLVCWKGNEQTRKAGCLG